MGPPHSRSGDCYSFLHFPICDFVLFPRSVVQMHNNFRQHTEAFPLGYAVRVNALSLAAQRPPRDSNGSPKDPKGTPN